MPSARSCPISCVWLSSWGGGETIEKLNLGNLIRDFRVYSFPAVLASSGWPAQFSQICSILPSREHNIKNGGGERRRRKSRKWGRTTRKGDERDQKGPFLISQLRIWTEMQPELTGPGYRSPGRLWPCGFSFHPHPAQH